MKKFTRFSNPFHPGEILLEEFLEPKEMSQREFAHKIGWTPRKLNEIINGKRSITALSAIDLSRALGTTPEFWLNLQQTWDLNQAYKLKKAA
ncbi:MAG TPA: HigA family addiction module antitoxin [Bdellovibrionota bacterium]|nr:HigA family addiction module antitoxin [Bdellovibrionota bacterium]